MKMVFILDMRSNKLYKYLLLGESRAHIKRPFTTVDAACKILLLFGAHRMPTAQVLSCDMQKIVANLSLGVILLSL